MSEFDFAVLQTFSEKYGVPLYDCMAVFSVYGERGLFDEVPKALESFDCDAWYAAHEL